MSGSEGRDPVEDFEAINAELKQYSPELAGRKMIVAANKVDIMEDPALLDRLRAHVESQGMELFEISAAAHQGTRELVKRRCPGAPAAAPCDGVRAHLRGASPRGGHQRQRVHREVRRHLGGGGPLAPAAHGQRQLLGTIESRNWFDQKLRQSGLFDKLEEMGIQDGDIVSLYDLEFEYQR